jgi:hypothetical protein
MQAASGVQRLHQVMRNALIVSAVILAALGLDLTLFPNETAKYFSWEIKPPLTAGTLGAFYLAAFVILVLSLAGLTWARARVVLPGGIAFSALAFLVTFLHLDKFNFDSPHTSAVVVTWVWTIAYGILTPVLLLALIPQRKMPGGDPVTGPTPSWLRQALLGVGGLLSLVGVLLYLIPEQVAKVWPWDLTALTGQVLGAWSLGFGLVMVVASRQDDKFRVFPAAVGLAAYGLFQLLTVVRFNGDVAWGEPGAWVYVAFLAATLFVGLAGASATRTAAPAPEPSSAAPAPPAPPAASAPTFQP